MKDTNYMADEIRVNRAPQMQPQGMPKQDMPMQNDSMMMQQKNSKAPWMILAVIVVVIVLLAVLFRQKLFMVKSAASSDGFQAVFLTNGQVYFGKLSAGDTAYADLKDIYYLQVGPQQGSGAQAQAQQSISLVKLGNELHGPVDEMHISRAQILFYEDLKNDGSVVKAIQQYKANPQGAVPAPAAQQAPAQQQQVAPITPTVPVK